MEEQRLKGTHFLTMVILKSPDLGLAHVFVNVQNLRGLLRDFHFVKQGSLWGKAKRCLGRKIKILWIGNWSPQCKVIAFCLIK